MSDVTKRDFDPSIRGPLAGIRVIDLSRLVSGGHFSAVLADLGADVIKVERPGSGDELRDAQVDGVAAYWEVYGRNKRSIVIDLKRPQGVELLKRLVASADVFAENFRPGKLEELGIDPETLLGANPNLVVLRISGWGQTGPYAHRPGFGTLAEAVSGFTLRNGFADRPPLPAPIALADMVCGLYAANAVQAALHHVRSGGKGQVVDVSLFEPLFSIMGPDALLDQMEAVPTRGQGTRASSVKGIFRCRDGRWVAMSAATNTLVERFFASIDRSDLLQDPRYATHSSRLDHRDEINEIIEAWFAERPRDAAIDHMERAGVTAAPLYDVGDAAHDPHFQAREVVVEVPGTTEILPRVRMHNIVPKLSETPSGFRYPAPKLGEHTEQVLAEAGLSESEIEALAEEGVIRR